MKQCTVWRWSLDFNHIIISSFMFVPWILTSSTKSFGPFPLNVSITSITSKEFPIAIPIGVSILVSTAVVLIPWSRAAPTCNLQQRRSIGFVFCLLYSCYIKYFTRLLATRRASFKLLKKAARPTLTSKTSELTFSAAFFEMIEAVRRTNFNKVHSIKTWTRLKPTCR